MHWCIKKIIELYCFFKYIVHPRRLNALVVAVNVEELRLWLDSYAFRNNNSWIRDYAKPWIVFGAVNELEKIVSPKFRIYEFGSGGSTIWFAKRCRRVTSVECDPSWGQKIITWLSELNIINARIEIKPPILNVPARSLCVNKIDIKCECEYDHLPFVSEDGSAPYGDYYDFVVAINDEPDESFDLILVDSWARIPCIYLAYNKITPNGYLVLDNSDWDYYKPVQDFLISQGWNKIDYHGNGAHYLNIRWSTSIFQKPPSCNKLTIEIKKSQMLKFQSDS